MVLQDTSTSSPSAKAGERRAPRKRSSASPPSAAKSGEKKTRTKTGCLTCRQRRVKCGEERPSCRNCIKRGKQCVYGCGDLVWSRSPNPASPADASDPPVDLSFFPDPGVFNFNESVNPVLAVPSIWVDTNQSFAWTSPASWHSPSTGAWPEVSSWSRPEVTMAHHPLTPQSCGSYSTATEIDDGFAELELMQAIDPALRDLDVDAGDLGALTLTSPQGYSSCLDPAYPLQSAHAGFSFPMPAPAYPPYVQSPCATPHFQDMTGLGHGMDGRFATSQPAGFLDPVSWAHDGPDPRRVPLSI